MDPDSHRAAVHRVRRYMESLPQSAPFREEIRSHHFWKAVRAELLATMLLIVLGCGSSVLLVPEDTKSSQPTFVTGSHHTVADLGVVDLKVGLAFGISVATLVQCFGNISGAHLNPVVSVALLIQRSISPLRAVAYILAQCIGSVAGGGILYGLLPVEGRGALVTRIHPLVTHTQAFGVEFMISLTVVITVLSNLNPCRVDLGFKALSIGLAYTLGHLFGYQWTGASMNPVRSLGPAVVTMSWESHWLYWLGPMLAGILGAFTYELTSETSNYGSVVRRSFHRETPEQNSAMVRDTSAASNSTELGLLHAVH